MALTDNQKRAIAIARARKRQQEAVATEPEAQEAPEVGTLSALGSGFRRGVEEISGGAGQRLGELLFSFSRNELKELADGISSGQIPQTPENIERFDKLSILVNEGNRMLEGAEAREKERREEFAPIAENSPIAATTGRIAGQILPTIAAGPTSVPSTLAGRAALGGATGAAVGASQPTIGDESAAGRAAVGAATGLVGVPALEKVVAPAVRGVASPIANFFTKRSATKQKIAELVEQNSDDIQRAAFVKPPQPAPQASATANAQATANVNIQAPPRVAASPVKSAAFREARKQGVDDGTAALIGSASEADKVAMRKAIDILKKSRRSKTFAVSNRPGDAAGDVLKARHDAVTKINREAGKEINKAALELKGKNADLNQAYDDFFQEIENLGVTFGRTKSGKLKGVYDNSEFAQSKTTQKLLNDFIAKSEKGFMDGLDAHRLKRVIDGAVEFGKKNTKPILAKGEGALKTLRRGINDSLKGLSNNYKLANEKFADTKSALDDFQKAAGPSFNPRSENASKRLVNVARALMSNNQKRVEAMDAVNALQEAAKKHGTTFDDDILKQAAFMDELETLFGSSAPTSFGGQIEKAAGRAIRGDGAGIAAEVVEEGVKRARGINEDNLIKAIEELLR